mmetsp:Transcript_24974/g.27553  ORF Transcript_24974/g.27553 Transcript_24974/m.27553 type:complete len:210 (-) Transcript_24974:55-684(-)
MTVPFHFVPGVKTDSGIRISNGIFRMICCSFLIRFSTSRMNNTMRLFLSKLVSFRSVGSSLETVYFCFARRLLGFKFDHLEFLFSPLLLLEVVTSAGLSSSSSCSKEILSSLNSTKSFLPRLIFFVDSEVSSSPSSSSLSKEIESITSSLFCSAILSSSISVVDSEEERKSALLLLCCFVLHNKSATSGGGGGENDNDNLHNNDENKNT